MLRYMRNVIFSNLVSQVGHGISNRKNKSSDGHIVFAASFDFRTLRPLVIYIQWTRIVGMVSPISEAVHSAQVRKSMRWRKTAESLQKRRLEMASILHPWTPHHRLPIK